MKKIMLGMGTVATIVAPVAAVISCGEDNDNTTPKVIADFKDELKMKISVSNATTMATKGATGVGELKVDAVVTEAQLGISLPALPNGVTLKDGMKIETPYAAATNSVDIKIILVYEKEEFEHTFTVYASDSTKGVEMAQPKVDALKAKFDLISLTGTGTVAAVTSATPLTDAILQTIKGTGGVMTGAFPTAEDMAGMTVTYTVPTEITKPPAPASGQPTATATGTLVVKITDTVSGAHATSDINITITTPAP